MLSQVSSLTTFCSGTVAPTKILEFRSQYQSCRIQAPDLQQPMAFILVDRECYSFFKAVREADKVSILATKLETVRTKQQLLKLVAIMQFGLNSQKADAVKPS